MTWPTPQDYYESVQNPQENFTDPELRRGSLSVSKLGLPIVASGAFASVYRMKCGDKRFAVRCFLREIPNQNVRYERISRYVMSDALPYTVEFNYLQEGILLRGNWYPILKMDWVHGITLDDYVKDNLSKPERLLDITERFKTMMSDLHEAGIAHGDLQHGNIMVTEGGELRLVDYDGMFVPELAGFESNEIGHRNYQHPSRSASNFNASVDNFSAWSIYVSLFCLSVDQSLAKQVGGCDESLLFRQNDYRYPLSSPVFAVLESHTDKRISEKAKLLRSMLSLTVESIPYLTEDLKAPEALPELQPSIEFYATSGAELTASSAKNIEAAKQGTGHLWPSLTEYVKAVSNPSKNFIDPRMQQYILVREKDHSIHAEGTEHGAVFRFRKDSGGFVIIKVFLKGDELITLRYEKLRDLIHLDGEHLSALGKHFADFAVIREGLKVEKNYYSIIRMEHLDMPTLFQAVDEGRGDKQRMKQLITGLCKLMEVLEKFGIVHGDIEPANILVGANNLLLVDYDLTTTPLSRPLASAMLGSRHMQHPRTKKGGAQVNDRFSAWILLYSLRLIMLYPTLWNIAGAKPGRLLFQSEDLRNPGDSQLFKMLHAHFNSEVRKIAVDIERLCKTPPSEIPPLKHSFAVKLVDNLLPAPLSAQRRTAAPEYIVRLAKVPTALIVVSGVNLSLASGFALGALFKVPSLYLLFLVTGLVLTGYLIIVIEIEKERKSP